MTWQWYVAWFNLIFAVPFLLALLYLIVYAASGMTFGDPESDAAADAAADADAHAEVEGDADADGDAHDAGDGHDAEAGDVKSGVMDALLAPGHHGAETPAIDNMAAMKTPASRKALHKLGLDRSTYRQVLRYFGVGRVPLSILFMVLFFAWGFIGGAINMGLRTDPRFAADPWQVSIPAAFVGSALLTRGLSRLFAKWMPTTETYARERASLVGLTGEAMLPIDQNFGMAMIRDERGTVHQVACRVLAGARAIDKGQPICLAEYDSQQNIYFVTASEGQPKAI